METRRLVEDFPQSNASDDSHSEDRLEVYVNSLQRRPVDSETTHSELLSSDPRHPMTEIGTRPFDMDHLGWLFDKCIQEVRGLEAQRDELIRELLCLHAPMLQAVAYLRRKVEEARKTLTLVQLDHIGVCEDVQQVKKRLLRAARGCIQSQVTLAAQNTVITQRSTFEELSELQEAHRHKLSCLRDEARKPSRGLARSLSDVSHCRRASLSLQRRLSGSMRSLEGWYEPRLMALLRRRQAGEEALRKSKELGQDLSVRLGPLEQDVQRLELQRACLEDRMVLMERDRRDCKAQYEVMDMLEETLRDLKVEFEIQRKSTTHLQSLKDGLLRELAGFRYNFSMSTSLKAQYQHCVTHYLLVIIIEAAMMPENRRQKMTHESLPPLNTK
uniref:Syncoilin n=1 Tax=Gadus morhua TaxID=8049 RepID=A0A8C5FQ74_GADMO